MKELPGKNPEHHGIDQRRNRREFFGKTGAAAVAPGALSYEVLIQWQARDAPQNVEKQQPGHARSAARWFKFCHPILA